VRAAADRGRPFLPLPIIASVLFIVVVIGNQSFGGYLGFYSGGSTALRSIPNVATVWAQMLVSPSDPDGYYSLNAVDTIAAIYPIPGDDNTEVTVIFSSLQGVPFKMTYYSFYQSMLGDLYPGARVYAYFHFYHGVDGPGTWRLGYVININTLR